MKIIELIQGSPEWHAHRATHLNASDAPAMMGVSPYKSRTQLIHETAVGRVEDHDAATQRRFDEGHRFEALARPLAEEIIGEELYPVVGVLGKYSASFDGLTMAEDVSFEHKRINEEIRACQTAEELPLMYRVQMEQQMMVSEAGKSLFLATLWDDQDQLIEKKEFWYLPDLELRKKLIAGWEQFEADVAAYVPQEVIPASVAQPTLALPALNVQVMGSVSVRDNLTVFGNALKSYIEGLNQKPETDQDFADLDAATKKLDDAEKALTAAEDSALAQTASIEEMRRSVSLYRDLARTTRLAIEKLVDAEKKNRKNLIIQGGKDALAKHIADLNSKIGKAYMPAVAADFVAVTKSKRTIATLKSAVDDELARAKAEANMIAERISANMASLSEVYAQGNGHLFADEAQIIGKAPDDLAALIKLRVTEEADRLERVRAEAAERERLASEAKAQEQTSAITNPAPTLNEVLDAVAPEPIAQAMKAAPAPWQAVRNRVGKELDRLSVAQLELVSTYIAKTFPNQEAA